MGNRTCSYLASISALSIVLCVYSSVPGQANPRPKLKNFGSSLKRIKWDPEKKIAVQTKSQSDSKIDSGDVDVVRVETSLVTNDLLVLDARGQSVAGLTEKDFVVTEDGTSQQVGMFSLGDNVNVPRSIVLIIDYSGSQFPFIKTSVAAAKALVDKLTPVDQMAIVTDDVELLQDFTNHKQQLKDKLDLLLNRVYPTITEGYVSHKFGRSKQYSALMATLTEGFNAQDQRPIIIFQTDGDELGYLRNSPLKTDSLNLAGPADKKALEAWRQRIEANRKEFSLEDICRAAEKSSATIYTVVPGFQLLGLSAEDQLKQVRAGIMAMTGQSNGSQSARRFDSMMTPEMWKTMLEAQVRQQAALAAVATSTGGWTMFLEKPADADHIYSSIFSDINRRYIVGYYPTNKEHDGKR